MTENSNVSPVVKRILEKQEADALAKQNQGQQVQQDQDQGENKHSENTTDQQTSIATSESTTETSSEQNKVPEIKVDFSNQEPAVITTDFSTPLPQQQQPTEKIDLVEIARTTAIEQRSAAIAAVAPEKPANNFYVDRIAQLLDNYEKETGPLQAFNKDTFHKVHYSLNSFLFISLDKAMGKEFIDIMDSIINRMRDPQKRKNYYNLTKFFRGAEKCNEAYVALFNVLFDASNKLNHQRLKTVNFSRIFGVTIGEKLRDYFSRIGA